MSKDMIRYDLLAQDALRGVVRRVLADVAKAGYLPGDHHFYIAFLTTYPGARLSQRLREQYPEEMTIVLQHQFWDLSVTEHAFEVGLSFGGVPERLLVPFEAITQFFDPSANFGVKFEMLPSEAEAEATPSASKPKTLSPVTAVPAPSDERAPTKKPAPRGAGTEPTALPPKAVPQLRAGKGADEAPPTPPQREAAPAAEASRAESGKADVEPKGAQVLSLDKFRKK